MCRMVQTMLLTYRTPAEKGSSETIELYALLSSMRIFRSVIQLGNAF